MLDECFMELTGQAAQYSMLREIDSYEKLLILRAFTKSVCNAGHQIGISGRKAGSFKQRTKKAVTGMERINTCTGCGVSALADTRYLERACRLIGSERERMGRELEKLGCKVYPSDTNYILFYVKPIRQAEKHRPESWQ